MKNENIKPKRKAGMRSDCGIYNRLVSRIRVAMASYSDAPIESIPMNAHVVNDLEHFFGYDETAFLEVVASIEEELEISLNENLDPMILELKTVRDFADYIVNYFKCIHYDKPHPVLDKNPEFKRHDKSEYYSMAIVPTV